jgi:Co/Zn/Cd efflux system component
VRASTQNYRSLHRRELTAIGSRKQKRVDAFSLAFFGVHCRAVNQMVVWECCTFHHDAMIHVEYRKELQEATITTNVINNITGLVTLMAGEGIQYEEDEMR